MAVSTHYVIVEHLRVAQRGQSFSLSERCTIPGMLLTSFGYSRNEVLEVRGIGAAASYAMEDESAY